MINRFIRKPTSGGEWKSEELFRMYCSMNKIDIIQSQPLICLTCGSMPARDTGGKCMVCGAQDFAKPDFIVRGAFPVFVDGEIHDLKQKIQDRDMEQDKALINRGRLPIRVRSEDLKNAMAK